MVLDEGCFVPYSLHGAIIEDQRLLARVAIPNIAFIMQNKSSASTTSRWQWNDPDSPSMKVGNHRILNLEFS